MMAIFGAILPRFVLLVGWSNDPTAWTFALVFLGISLATSISSDTPVLHVWPPWVALMWVLGSVTGSTVGFTVALSVVLHGLSAGPLAACWLENQAA